MDLKHIPYTVKGQIAQCDHDPQLLKNKWSNFFFNATIMNETNYFLKMQYTTKSNAELREETMDLTGSLRRTISESTDEDLQIKHLKLIGFIESRLKGFLQTLQVELIKLRKTKDNIQDP